LIRKEIGDTAAYISSCTTGRDYKTYETNGGILPPN
jgi:hypothetical protein